MSISIQPFWGVSNLLPRNVCPIKFQNNFFLIYASSLSIIISKVNQKNNEIELVQLLNPIDSDNFEANKYFENISSVELNENNGNLVFTIGNLIYIYKCEKVEEEKTKIKGENEVGLIIFSDIDNTSNDNRTQFNWIFDCVLQCDSIVTGATWFNNGNLLTTGEEVIIWIYRVKSYIKSANYKPANIVYLSSLSPDNHWFATIGKNDKLVKIWQVPSSESPQFKPIPYSYLKHPRTVIEIRWKLNSKKYLGENTAEQLPVVCTWCLDGIFRIWSPVNPLQPTSFFLCGNINPCNFLTTETVTSPNQSHLEECGSVTKTSCMLSNDFHQSQQSFQSSPFHWVNSNVLKSLVEHELKLLTKKKELGVEMTHMDEFHEQLLKDLLDREPDLLFRIQQDGSLTFWRVENLGKLPYRTCKIFMMTRIPNAFSLNLSKESNGPGWVVDAFMGDSSAVLTVYVHTIKGEITQFNMKLSDLLFPDQSGSQVTTQNIWSGQHGNTSILQGFNNGYQISVSSDNDVGVFISDPEFNHSKLTKTFAFTIDNLKCFDLLNELTFVFLDDKFIYLYIFPHKNTYEHLHLNKTSHSTSVTKLKVFDCKSTKFDKLIVGFDFNQNESYFWSYKHANQSVHELHYLGSDKIPFDIGDSFDWVHSFDTKFNDTHLVDSVVSYNKSCQINIWSVDLDKVGNNCWTLKSKLDLSHYKLNNILIRVGYKGELALIPKGNTDYHALTLDLNFLKFNIYNLIELKANGSEGDITDLAWGFSSTQDQFLAISFTSKVYIYCLNNSEKELKWEKINELKLPEYVKDPISHLSFNTSGSLLISAGSQMFNLFIWKDSKWMLSELIAQYPLKQLYNPNLIFNLLSFGLNNIMNLTLKHANQFFTQQYPDINESTLIIPPLSYKYFVDLDSSDSKPVSHTAEALFSSATALWGSEDDTNTDPSTPPTMNQFNKLLDYLERYEVENLTKQEKLAFKQVVQLYRETKSDLSTYDNLGYYFYFIDKYSTQLKLNIPKPLAWAYTSETQIQLLSSNLSNLTEEPSWEKLKELGVHLWTQSDYQLSVEIEKFCRNQFSIDREPSRCGLFYLAMKKRRLLLAMWKSSTHHKEQSSMVKFLLNDFEEDRWKKAALKNAFVLISRQRYWDAVSFFLLGESLKDSINVCLKYLEDIDLALLICRLFEGIKSDISQSIIKEHIIPAAINLGDRNKIFICYNLIEEPLKAIKSLILPLIDLFPNSINEDNRLNMTNSIPLPELYILLQSRKNGKVSIDIEDEVKGIVNSLNYFLKIGSPNLAFILLIKWKKLADSRLNETNESSDSLASQQSSMIDSGQIDFDSWGWGSTPTPVASKASSTTLDKLSSDSIKLGEKSRDSDNRQYLQDLEPIIERINDQLTKEYINFQSHASRLLEDLDPSNWQTYQKTWQEGLINLKKALTDDFFY